MADVDAKIPTLREEFLKKYEGNIIDDTYDSRDVDRVKTDDRFMRSVLKAYKAGGDVKKAVDLLHESLAFSAKMKLNDLTEDKLNAELKERNGVYYSGVDKEGRKLLHFRVCKQKKGHLIAEAKTYIAYYIFQHYKENPEQQLIFFFDFVDAGVSNMDMDVTKYIIKCASTYFPSVSAFNLMFKMGVALEAIWKIIKGFLDADQSKKTYFVTRKNVQEYINQDQLLPHMLKEEKK